MKKDDSNLLNIVRRIEFLEPYKITWSIEKSSKSFYLKIVIDSSFLIESSFKANSLKLLKTKLNKSVSLNKEDGSLTIKSVQGNKVSLLRHNDEKLWVGLFMSFVEIRNFIDGLIIGKQIVK